ncbi:uncharacterized protein LOC120210281 [Hibiscus syriacus]|uniref:uncharacterized protein LOC120210281 n=1 Tax=Hibiscus syriacus TaxID=106335 RepID=UPI0019208D00|nr:uncharacterized protein LOC120210281 [Hibiscus syriacus]
MAPRSLLSLWEFKVRGEPRKNSRLFNKLILVNFLSDANKRFLYDVGAYDSDDDENGMGDFLNEMAVMMSQQNLMKMRRKALRNYRNCLKRCSKWTLIHSGRMVSRLRLVLLHLRSHLSVKVLAPTSRNLRYEFQRDDAGEYI